MFVCDSYISGNNGPLTTRRERPKSAKHGVRSRMIESNNHIQQPEAQRHSEVHNPTLQSDLDFEERVQSNMNRPKSAKFKSRRTVGGGDGGGGNGNPFEDENDLIMSRPKSAKHGRRARNPLLSDSSNQNGNHSNNSGNHGVEGISIPDGIFSAEEVQTPRPLYRPKSAGVRKRGHEQHIGSNGK